MSDSVSSNHQAVGPGVAGPEAEILRTIEERHRSATATSSRWHAAHTALAALSAIASAVAAVCAGSRWIEGFSLATIAAIPGAVAVAQSSLKIEKRALWHGELAQHLDALRNAVRFEGLRAAQASRELARMGKDMDRKWDPRTGGEPKGE